jgi:hypothetical protein
VLAHAISVPRGCSTLSTNTIVDVVQIIVEPRLPKLA